MFKINLGIHFIRKRGVYISSSSSSFKETDDADVWREVALALADDEGEKDLERHVEFWKHVSLILQYQPDGESIFSRRNIHDEGDRGGLEGSSSAHRESSRKRKRDQI